MFRRSLGWMWCALLLSGCVRPVNLPALSSDTLSTDQAQSAAGAMPVLPWAGGQGATSPWGGADSSRWRPEAVLANAASQALNEAWSQSGVQDAIVAVPTRILNSTFHPYGDGQSNAAVSFESWNASRPPVVATLSRFAGHSSRVAFRFDRSLNLTDGRIELQDGSKTTEITATKSSTGDWVAQWTPTSDLGWDGNYSNMVLLVHPRGWQDWFPVWFRMPVRPIADLYATVPSSMRTFADGRGILDHEGVSDQPNTGKIGTRQVQHLETGAEVEASTLAALTAGSSTPFQKLIALAQRHGLSSAYNQDPYQPQDIHAEFPSGGRNVVTAVGRGWTWVAQQPAAPFKILYTAFERRRADLEASAPDGGVPSGGGWHQIGDPAETILNDLESAPIVVGTATNQPLDASRLPSGQYSYGLSDVATIRWLRPGEAFTTKRGQGNQLNYHWFCFQQDHEVTTEEWVHPTVPDDRYDFE